jgi:integrase
VTYAVQQYKPKRRAEKIARLIADGEEPARAHKSVPIQWEAIIRLTLPSGRKLEDRKLTPAKSKSGARAWAQARETELLKQATSPKQEQKRRAPTLRAYWPRYVEACIADGLADSTMELKQSNFSAWLSEHLGELPLDEITNTKQSALRLAMRTAGVGETNVMQTLSACLRCALRHKVIDAMPCEFGKTVRLKRADPGHAPFYYDEQLEALLAAASDDETRAAILLGADAGLRAGELAGLEWSDIQLDRARGPLRLSVNRSIWYGVPAAKYATWVESGKDPCKRPEPEFVIKRPKSGQGRDVALGTGRLATALRKLRLRAGDRERVLGPDLHRDIIADWLAAAERAAGLAADREGCVHKLRHTFCSALALRGVPPHVIMKLAGHHSLSITQRYMHLSPNSEAAAVAKLEAPLAAAETRPETLDDESATG